MKRRPVVFLFRATGRGYGNKVFKVTKVFKVFKAFKVLGQTGWTLAGGSRVSR